ncbi:MAG: hypothetical protein IKY98_05655 [Alphaproteobacteria bacterium]|nr:hypothetical protein [Alphaproteobacteria bacterium]
MSNQRITSVLENYTGEPASLDAFVTVATEELGADWTGKIYDEMSDVSDGVKERLDHAFNYYAATTAWNELQSYLTQETPLDYAKTLERIPVLEHWLSFFGAAGDEAVSQLKNKLRQEGEQSNQNTSLLTNPFEAVQSMPTDNAPVVEPVNTEALDEQTQRQVQDIFTQAPEMNEASNALSDYLDNASQVSDDNQETVSDEVSAIFDEASEGQSDEVAKINDHSSVMIPVLSEATEGISEIPLNEDSEVLSQDISTISPINEEEETAEPSVFNNQTHTNEAIQSPVLDGVQENRRTDVFDPIASQGAALENNTQTAQSEEAWLVGKIFRQIDFISNIESWISFRCLELGYTDFYTYRYYGFLVDVLDKTIEELKDILNRVELYDLIETRYPNGVQYLQNRLLAYEKESQEAHENVLSDLSELPNENLSADDLRHRLGGIDTSMEKEYLGPAPDGFEMIDDPYESLDETAVQKEYEKIEAEGNLMPNTTIQSVSQQSVSSIPPAENQTNGIKNTSQTPQNGVQRKMTFSFKAKPAIKPDETGGATS